MKIFMVKNIKKTINYMKRNGIKKAVGAAYERLTAHYDADYCYVAPSTAELRQQRETVFQDAPLISILVPAYETDSFFLGSLIDSVIEQTYGNWELIIADASESDKVKNTLGEKLERLETENKQPCFSQNIVLKIKYHKLLKNGGISCNSNQALQFASGDYIGLLDHDDLLTPDALYEMVCRIQLLLGQGIEAKLLYSDEDKCDKSGKHFYEPNIKSDFNLDFLLSNNYICHFLIMEAELIKKLGFRPDYDGSQDYDLILRAIGRIKEEEIAHVEKVLYHWRCHDASTAANPASKLYAYEAGKRAMQDFLDHKAISGRVADTEHVGFYKIIYEPDILTARPDIGMAGGSVVDRDNKITSGILSQDGNCPFRGMPVFFAGPVNVMSVCRDAYALDARTVLMRKKDVCLFEEIMGVPYVEKLEERDMSYCRQLDEAIWKQRSMELSARIRERGQKLFWNPEVRVRN